MSKPSTTYAQFLDRAAQTHGSRYTYPDQTFYGLTKPVRIVCSKHGEFTLGAATHLKGGNCLACTRESKAKGAAGKLSANLASLEHLGYDFSKVSETYKTTVSLVTVGCPKHGEFPTSIHYLLRGKRCPKCRVEENAENHRVKYPDFLARAREVHGDTYEYVADSYTKFSEPMTIVCEVHGAYKQIPQNHTTGKRGCPKCANARNSAKASVSADSFFARAKLVHGDKYSYDESSYSGIVDPVTVVCNTHGSFEQLAYVHLRGSGCTRCASELNGERSRTTYEEFVTQATTVHDGYYSYSPEGYETAQSIVTINCPAHGQFKQKAADHLRGNRCQLCAKTVSKGQVEVLDYVRSLGFLDATGDYRYGATKREFDIFIPSKNFAIEYDGTYYHSSKFRADNYHLAKLREAEEAGITLVQIFSDQWEQVQPAVKSLLAYRLNAVDSKTYARLTTLVEVSNEEAQQFHTAYHIQGWKRFGTSYGLRLNGRLVAVMTFTAVSSQRGQAANGEDFELARYSSSYQVVGGASKLFSHFVKQAGPLSVISYSDDRLFSGNLYRTLGFAEHGKVPPSYTYWLNGQNRRAHKSHFRRTNLEKVLGTSFDPCLTERQNCENAGIYQVYDSGLTRWLWKRNPHV